MLTIMQRLLQKAQCATVLSRGLGSLICQSQPTSAICDGTWPSVEVTPPESVSWSEQRALCERVINMIALCHLCLPVAQIQCKQQSTNKCKYLKVSVKVPGLGNAWTGGERSQDRRSGGAGSHIPLVSISFVRLYNWAMLAICYQQLFLELAWGTAH